MAATKRGAARAFGWHRLRRLLPRVLLAAFAASVLLVAFYRFVPPPFTPLMVMRLFEGAGWHRDWEPYSRMSENLLKAVMAAEDTRFCEHGGFDWEAIEKAWDRNQRSRRVYGGSTITMQTAKNLFLWQDRSWLRKGLEAYFTFFLELLWDKRRILEVYVNVVEWGDGIYGAEAAAQHYFGKSAKELNRREAALLAAVLPNPRRWSPARPTRYINGRAATIQSRMGLLPRMQPDACP